MIDTDIEVPDTDLRKHYYAHTTKRSDKSDWQLQETHLKEVAELCKKYATPIGMGYEGYIAGLFHDIGKFSEKFQSRLEDNSIKGIDHWSNGTKFAYELGYQYAAFCIDGHHTGLCNMSDLSNTLKSLSSDKYKDIVGFDEPHNSIINKFNKSIGTSLPPISTIKSNAKRDFSTSMRIRMLFSCLIDADRTNTSDFANNIQKNKIAIDFPSLQPEKALSILLDALKSKSSNSPVGKLRNIVLSDCLNKATLPSGLFTLTVPTGGGKTLASTAFALKHSYIHNKNKIIYVIPFTTIIDQTADVLTDKDLKFNNHFGKDYVLEHHSAVEVEGNKMENYKIATSTWENPFVITTNVQFLESLFSNKTSDCRKLHNIANSVIILDEAQTLPLNLIKSTLSAIQVLVKEYNCTVVLCSATVPAFNNIKLETPLLPVEICTDPEALATNLRRTRIINNSKNKITHLNLAKKMSKKNQCLAVANTKSDVYNIYSELIELKNVNPADCFHLSTGMCAKHRKHSISIIKERLHSNEPCRVVSTQLIETGVDIDFPNGYRVLAPMESILQTAGRINREGKLKNKFGDFIMGRLELIDLVEGKTPKGNYIRCLNTTSAFITETKKIKWYSPDTYKKYYKRLYNQISDREDIVLTDSKELKFKDVFEKYKIIDDLTISVIVPYEKGIKYIDIIKNTQEIPHWLYRKLQLYTINIYRNSLTSLIESGNVSEVKCGDSSVYILNENYYDSKIGILSTPLKPNDYIV
jgi:CRISPR-associated helicase Cas3/CRISPR-associated endonuclease Cas3-HD